MWQESIPVPDSSMNAEEVDGFNLKMSHGARAEPMATWSTCRGIVALSSFLVPLPV